MENTVVKAPTCEVGDYRFKFRKTPDGSVRVTKELIDGLYGALPEDVRLEDAPPQVVALAKRL